MTTLKAEPGTTKSKCPWKEIASFMGGSTFWCEDCGTLWSSVQGLKEAQSPTHMDRDTYLCPDQGILP